MGIFDSFQFNPQSYGILGGLPDWLRTQEQAQAAFQEPTGWSDYGGMRTPIFGQAPQQPEVSAQARMPQQAMPQPMPAQPMQQPVQPQEPGLGDRMSAGLGGFMTNAHTGPIGALLGGIHGFATGDYGDAKNTTVKALMARGLDRTTAVAASRNPQLMAAVVPQLFGTRSGVNINNRLVDPTSGRIIADLSDTSKPVPLSNDQRLVNPMTGQQIVGPAQVPKFDDVSSMRKEITSLSEVKRLGESLPIFRSMVQSHGKDSSAADLDFVYGVAKIFDPESVVREGEMKLVGQAQSIPEDVKGFIKRAAFGEGRLSPEARARILEVAQTRMNELKGAYDARTSAYPEIAKRHNIKPEDIMPQMPEMPKLPEMSTGPKRVNSVADAMKLPPGTVFIDPQGVRRVR